MTEAPASRSAHVVEGLAYSVSTDGTTALLEFATSDGGRFRLTLPAKGIRRLGSMVADLSNQAIRQGINPGQSAFKRQGIDWHTFLVGHSDQARGHVAICFDQNLPTEVTYLIKDDAALQLCKMIGADLHERKAALKVSEHGVASPNRRIIIPGRN